MILFSIALNYIFIELLNKLKQHQDLEFAEIGVDDGIK